MCHPIRELESRNLFMGIVFRGFVNTRSSSLQFLWLRSWDWLRRLPLLWILVDLDKIRVATCVVMESEGPSLNGSKVGPSSAPRTVFTSMLISESGIPSDEPCTYFIEHFPNDDVLLGGFYAYGMKGRNNQFRELPQSEICIITCMDSLNKDRHGRMTDLPTYSGIAHNTQQDVSINAKVMYSKSIEYV